MAENSSANTDTNTVTADSDPTIKAGTLIIEADGGESKADAMAKNALTVGLGELVVCYVLGLPLLTVLEKRGVVNTAA